jgi:hypothetical protein
MKQRISTAAVIAALLFTMQAYAKGPPWRAVMLTDANGVQIGRVIGMDRIWRPYVLTDEGYRTTLNLGNSEFPASVNLTRLVMYYESTNCPKDEVAYLDWPGNSGTVFSPTIDLEYAYAEGILMYSPPDAQLVENVTVNSMLEDGVCDNFQESPITMDGFPAYLNDPNITGIANTPYPSRLIFK